jgi:hypothetical protein
MPAYASPRLPSLAVSVCILVTAAVPSSWPEAAAQRTRDSGSRPNERDPEAQRVVAQYIDAIGGATLLSAVTSRVTRGTFTNGRGLTAPFVAYFKAPDQIATIIGSDSIDARTGSGRAYNGTAGWDKNFIGTGLRDVTGAELQTLVRDASAFPIAHLVETCDRLAFEPASSLNEQTIRCEQAERTERWFFDRQSGLAIRRESTQSARTTVTSFEDYRRVDGALIAFRTRSVTGGNRVTYAAESVRHQIPVEDRVFRRPRS